MPRSSGEDDFAQINEEEIFADTNHGEKTTRGGGWKLVAGGLLLGAVAVFYFSQSGSKPAPSASAPMAASKEKQKPTPKPAIKPVGPETTAPAAPDKRLSLEEQLALLQKENFIGEDEAVPGAVGEGIEAPSTPGPPQERKSVAPAPAIAVENIPALPPAVRDDKSAPPPAPPDREGAQYWIRVSTTQDEFQAKSALKDLKEMGYPVSITTGKMKMTIYRVEVGRYKSVRDAAPMVRSLASNGLTSKIIYLERPKGVTLSLGEYPMREQAVAMTNRALEKGFDAQVKNRDEPKETFIVRVGAYDSRIEADAASAKLRSDGFNSLEIAIR